jgi:hypothetical protein
MNVRNLIPSPFLWLAVAGTLSVYLYFFSLINADYAPYYGDEYFYFKNSESFYLTGSLQAVFTYGGDGARLLGTDAHGPAYPLIYGSISKLFGWGGLTIPLVNLGMLLCATLALLGFSSSMPRIRQLQFLLIFGSPITLFYSVTYMPELLQIAGAIGLFLLVRRYLLTSSQADFTILIAYIFLLGSNRSTWFFAFFGLVILPIPVKALGKSLLCLLGLALPFLYQYFLHEQVPNTFSGLSEMIESQGLLAGMDAVFFNIRRNIYFAFTYTEGHFYTFQKLWIAATLTISILYYRRLKLIQFGTVILMIVMIFNVILYKNYSWVDLRMYTPMTLFLNLGMLSANRDSLPVFALLSLNLLSFVSILPLQKTLIDYRIDPDVYPIPAQTLEELSDLDEALVYIDSVLLKDYSLSKLPIQNDKGEAIQYILPYYNMKMKVPTHTFREESGQLKVAPVNILIQ